MSSSPNDELPIVDVEDDVLPLMFPHSVPKSSKDPNRGLYPKSKKVSHEPSRESEEPRAGPSFITASEVYSNNRLNRNVVGQLNKNPVDERLNKAPVAFDFPISWQALGRRYVPNEAAFRFSFSCEDATAPQRVVGRHPSELVPKRKKQKVDDHPPKNSLYNYFDSSKSNSSSSSSQSNTEAVQEDSIPVPSNDSNASEVSSSEPKAPYDIERDKNYYFGLFGATERCEEEPSCVNYFEWLPVSVMEQILCQVPFLDLLNLRLVCKSWNEIISGKRFIEWKKAYYRYKLENELDECFHEALATSFFETGVTDCFRSLLKFMTHKYSRRPAHNMMDLLQAAPMFKDAQAVLLERFTKWKVDTLSPWCVMTMLVILSETVWDISSILKCLLYNGSSCSVHDVLDAMYCIATFLLFFKLNYKINHGLHYRVYYALYLFENTTPQNLKSDEPCVNSLPGPSGQTSMHRYCQPVEQRLTYEQIRFLNHKLGADQIVKVVAFAGTGKTTTLIHYARLYPQLKFLNVMFNRAVCDYAKKVFPPNVECRTAHSLAFEAVGRSYRQKLCVKLKPHDIVPHINKPKSLKMHIFTYAKYVLQTIDNFTSSSDELITTAHVPVTSQIQCHRSVHAEIAIRSLQLTDQERLAIANEANEIWKQMLDTSNLQVRIVHDFYLKLYQLTHPVFYEYDCIMIDEAQDCNEAMLEIMLSQDLPVILVGDPNQQIYAFRGANNALLCIEATHTYHLTKSFRFGPEIAYIASCCIEILKCNSRQTLVGSDKQSFIDGSVKGQYAVIARTNLQLFQEAVRLCCTNVRRHNEPDTIFGSFAGGIAGYGLDQLLDIYKLSTGGEEILTIKDKFVKKFSSFEDLYTYAKKADDSELQGKLELVMQHGDKLVNYVKNIKRKCNFSMEMSNVVFSTAHKAKGLEFDTVCVTNDYRVGSVPCERPTADSPLGDEYNILYVALTRAKRCLLLSETLHKVLLLAQEKFEYPLSAARLLRDDTSLECVNCSTNFIPHTVLVLYRRPTTMANGRKLEGGPLCLKCSTTPRFRPEVHHAPAVVFLDFVEDTGHRSMSSIVGPLPSDPPIIYDDVMMPNIGAQHIIFQVIGLPR